MKHQHIPFRIHTTVFSAAMAVAIALSASQSVAGDLNLSDNALEVAINVEPNIMIVTDDSGSMDWEVMTTDYANSGLFTGTQPDGTSPAGSGSVKHHDNDDDGTANCTFTDGTFTGYLYIVEFGNNAYTDNSDDCNTADDEAWRIRNSDFNPLYFDPTKTYTPWAGVDINGDAYTDIDITNAPDDPYNPTEYINLTTDNANWTGSGRSTSDRDGDSVPDGFRYYTWDDTDGDGLFDDGEETEYLIKDQDADTQQNFANWFGYYRSRDFAAKAALSHAIEPAESSRIGFATINNNAGNRIRVASMNISPSSGNKKTLLDNLYETSPSNGTPLRTALRNTGRYFGCDSGDIFGSSSSSSPGDSDCPVEAAPAGQCQQNYTILMTDGFWGGSSPSVGNTDDDGGDYAGGAFEDSNSNTLADVAMYYYKEDLHTLDDDVPTSTRDIDRYLGSTDPFETMHQHMATYTVGFGVTGSLTADPTDPATAFTWPNPTSSSSAKIDDLRHAAYNGRGQFLSANDPTDLANAMSDIFNDIAKTTGTATAVAFNTQEVEAGTLVFRASFNTKTHAGDLVAHKVYSDGTIDPNNEWSAAEKLDDKISTASDSRVIITYKDTGSSSSAGIPFSWSDLTTGSPSQQENLNTPQPANVAAATNTFGDERLDYLRGHSDDEGPNGDDGEFRDRSADAGKLGDIVHSTPVFVGKPTYTQRDGGAYPATTGNTYAEFVSTYSGRTEITYVGANDGMLHAFDTNDGSEIFAYVPNLVFEKLSDLTDPDYSHQFYVDLTPAVNDAYFTPSSGTNSGTLSWNTVLVGGLAGGGKGYYALNVTDPDDLDSESEAKNNVLWEFTEADDGGVGSSDLGYTFSHPLIAMSNADDGSGNKVWVVIFGNGYNSTSTDGDSTLYILRLDGGQDGVWSSGTDFTKISTGYGIAESADGSTPNGLGDVRGIDTDGNGTVDYVYAGDLQGNMYRFDLSGSTMGSWDVAGGTGSAVPLFTAKYSATGDLQPITKRPIVISHPSKDGYVVITGTGSWMTTDDASTTDIQSIYGVWDNMDTNTTSYPVTHEVGDTELVEQTFSNHVNTEHGYTVRTLTNNTVSWKDTGGNKVKGWFIDLDVLDAATGSTVEYPGERAVRNLQLRGGILFANTIIPKSTDACAVGAGGYELGFNPENGGSGSNVIFDISGDNDFSELDNVNDTLGDAYIVTGIRFDSDMPTDSAFIGNRRMTQEGDDIRSFSTNTDNGGGAGRTSWREIITTY